MNVVYCLLACAVIAQPAGKKTVTFSENAWLDASNQSVRVDDVIVWVDRVAVQTIVVSELGKFKTSDSKYLVIDMKVGNLTTTRKIDYVGWFAKDAFGKPKHAPSLRDNFKNAYKWIDFGLLVDINWQVKELSLHPEKVLTDRLVYEIPLDNIKQLRVSLPTKGFDGSAKVIQFEIPHEMIDWPDRKVPERPRGIVYTPTDLHKAGKKVLGERITVEGRASIIPYGNHQVFIDFEVNGDHLVTSLAPISYLEMPRRVRLSKDKRYLVRMRGDVSKVGADGTVYLERINILNEFWLTR